MHRQGGYDDLPFLAELYDYASRAAADEHFYVQQVQGAEYVLELGCGTGRVLIPLAQSGLRVMGLDVSPRMLARCREKVAALPAEVQERISLAQGDMTDFSLDERFDLVLIPFRAFLHLITVEAQMGCLRSVARHLRESGRLIIDVFQPDPVILAKLGDLQEHEDVPETKLPDGRVVRRTSRFAAMRPSEQINDVELIFHVTHPDGREERLVQAFPFRYVFRYEMEHLLARCGFRIDTLYGDFDGSPLADKSPEMVFVASCLSGELRYSFS